MFLIVIVALRGTPTGIAAAAYAALGLIGIAALLGTRRRGLLDGRWLASRVAAWVSSIACVFAIATLIYTLIEWWSGNTPGIVSMAMITASCGMLWNPLFGVLQRVADGALFGFRPDALTAAQRVAVSIGNDPTAAIRAIQEGLVLPYAALALVGDDDIAVGTPTEGRRIFPIDSDDEHIGQLVVGIRPGDLGCPVTTNAYIRCPCRCWCRRSGHSPRPQVSNEREPQLPRRARRNSVGCGATS